MLVYLNVDSHGLGSDTLFTLDSSAYVSDSNGISWNPKYPINVSIKRTDPIVTLEHSSIGTAKNAFEEEYKLASGEKCSASEICCENGFKRRLTYSSNEYNLFSITSIYAKYCITITIFQQDVSYSLNISPQHKTDSNKGVVASLEYDMIQFNAIDYRDYVYVVDSAKFGVAEGFIVPKKHFGSNANQIGITQETYKRNANCLQPVGSITKIGTNTRDQFYDFRDNHIFSAMGCNFIYQEQQSLSVLCPKTTSTSLTIELPINGDSGFKIDKLVGDPYVVSKGALIVQPNKMSLFIDVFNDIESTGKLEVELNSCCFLKKEKQACTDASFSIKNVKTIGPYDTKRVYFSVIPITTDFDKGFCKVYIGQYGKVEKDEEIPFTMHDATTIDTTTTISCYPPKLKTIVGGKVVCITDCPTVDTIYNETIYQCVPVDCSAKYRGLKEFFNHTTLKCEEKKKCEEWKEDYDYSNNLCVTKKEYDSKPSSNYQLCTENDFTSSNFHPLNCGCGYMDRMGTICKCPNGIVTSEESNAFCDINMNDLRPVPSSLELPKPTFFETLCDIPNWAQILLIALFIILLLSPLPLGLLFVFCCIKKIDPKKEAMKQKYGELKKKSILRRLKTAVVKGDFCAHEYKLADEKKEQLRLLKFEKKKLQKKKKKTRVQMTKQ